MTTGESASRQYDHFLLTRFNVRSGAAPASQEWLRHRLRFFETMCYRSVSAQTSDAFTWLVFFDAERDQWFQNVIDRLSAGRFEPIWVDGGLSTELIAEVVAARSTAPWIITTRMDNDDAVARDFIESVQREFRCQECEFLNFPSGLQLSEDGRLFAWTDPSNPFITLVEKRDGGLPRTVHVAGHDKLEQHGQIAQIATHPMWAQMIHAKNLANAVKGIQVGPKALEDFDIGHVVEPISLLTLRASQVRNIAGLAKRVLSDPRKIRKATRILKDKITR